MTAYSMGMRAIYAAQRYSRELAESVWSGWFYDHLLDVLKNETWREYQTEAYGRHCEFDDLRKFLGHQDGLGWPSVDETLLMMQVVRDCKNPLPPEENGPAGPDLKEWARQALAALEGRGVTVLAGAALQAQPLAQHGANQHSEPEGEDVFTTPPVQRGSTNSDYLLRRLARDAPEVLERVKSGEFKSARAAAIEAGIIKPVPTIRLVDDPAKVAAALRKHLSPEQLEALKQLL